MAWDIDAAVAALRANAVAESTGACARFVRQAVAAGGIALPRTANSAKDFGPGLISSGFVEQSLKEGEDYKKGDIVVIQNTTGHPHGHIQIFDGKIWISDFRQNGFWPGPNYRKFTPSYKLYRYSQ